MDSLVETLLAEISKVSVIDPHSHIDPRHPTARDLDDLYRSAADLAVAAGMDADPLRSDVPAEERARALARFLPAIENTTTYRMILDVARTLFDFPGSRLDEGTIGEIWSSAERTLNQEGWAENLFHRSRVEKIFVTSAFDDDLQGFDTRRYVPGLRADDLIFRLSDPSVVERLRQASSTDIGNGAGLEEALSVVFRRFRDLGCASCVAALGSDFAPATVPRSAVDPVLRRVLSGDEPSEAERRQIGAFVLGKLAALCAEHGVAMHLMLGVERASLRAEGKPSRDLVDRAIALAPFRTLFTEFPAVSFAVSVLPGEADHELAAYAATFPNVHACGHAACSSMPVLVENALRARIQAVPRTKQIGFFSDASKLEFVRPRFDVYRRILADVLAEDVVRGLGWSETRAVELGRDILRGNAERVFLGAPATTEEGPIR